MATNKSKKDADERTGAYQPLYLGKRHSGPVSEVDLIPWKGEGSITVTLECAEFTSLCPVTSQADFGRITIRYEPVDSLIETKSLKLYLGGFRETGIFSEALVDRIAADLWSQLKPNWIKVEGCFNSRGGIGIRVEACRPAEADDEV